MPREKCVLCGRRAAGLRVRGRLLCFSCEKRLVFCSVPIRRQKRLLRLYAGT